MTEAIKFEGYIPVVPNEVYSQDIEITSPYDYVFENGVMKPAVIGCNTKVITFAKVKGLNKAVLETLVREAETATHLHTTSFNESNRIKMLKKGILVPYIPAESPIQRLLLSRPYDQIVRIFNKTSAALEYMDSLEEKDTKKRLDSNPEMLILRFALLSGNTLETDDTSNPFFSIGKQIEEEIKAGLCKNPLFISLSLKKGKISEKEKIYENLSKTPKEYQIELKAIFDGLFAKYGPDCEGIDMVPIRELTPDIINLCAFNTISRL